ncbi:hypothetical protein F7725_013377 [Dissostichus mawsoni]|uniref:L1 transposable element RRM domain-containing protein n=1 Tax=Dissostichus mawsoni TaxID=36200 RepID=A0A7J5YQ78_DISMA|nr:hypothetical protein F7725_013377 [Dissostichus mawsoni]
MYQQLSANTKTLQAQGSRIAEAEGRIAETETWNMEVKDALCKSLKQQQMLQDKLTDIEGRNGPEESLAKKIVVEGRPLIFDHDYATEVVQKRKAYNGIKKLLKEKGIRFQTPLTKMRIHWDDGPKLYGSAQEAACDMRNGDSPWDQLGSPPGP